MSKHKRRRRTEPVTRPQLYRALHYIRDEIINAIVNAMPATVESIDVTPEAWTHWNGPVIATEEEHRTA